MKRIDREFMAQILANKPIRPFANGELVLDGKQLGAEISTADAAWTTVETVEIDLGTTAKILYVEFYLYCKLKSTGVTRDVKYKAQARNLRGTWVDILSEQTLANPGATYVAKSITGMFKPETNFNQVPCEVRLQIQREDGEEEAVGVIRSDSFITICCHPRLELEQ